MGEKKFGAQYYLVIDRYGEQDNFAPEIRKDITKCLLLFDNKSVERFAEAVGLNEVDKIRLQRIQDAYPRVNKANVSNIGINWMYTSDTFRL